MSDLNPDEVESVSQAIDGQEEGSSVNIIEDPSQIFRPQLYVDDLAASTDLPPTEIERMSQLRISLEIQFGKTRLPIEEILKLRTGSIIEFDQVINEPLNILVNGKIIAKAEAVVIEENYGIKILEIVGTQEKLNVVRKEESHG